MIAPASAITDANGAAVFTVSPDTVGLNEFQATVEGVAVNPLAGINFIDPTTPFAVNVNFEQFSPSLGTFAPSGELFGPAGGLGESWNQFAANSSNGTLLAADGVLTGISFTSTFSEGRGDGTGATPMLRSTLTDFGRGSSRSLTISGLQPGAIHDVWLTSFRNQPTANERTFGRWTANNPTSSSSVQFIDNRDGQNGTTFVEGYNYIVFQSVVVDVNGQISFDVKGMTPDDGADDSYRLGLSGFQLTPVGEALITSFGIPGSDGVIDQDAKTISLTVPFDTDLDALAPTFTITSGTADPESGVAPSPSFAVQNPATYTVTDNTTDPVTVNEYTVTVIVEAEPPPTTTLVIDLGAGTVIPGNTTGTFDAGNLQIPELPVGSILRSIATDLVLESSDAFNFASDLALIFDLDAEVPQRLSITNGMQNFGASLVLGWPQAADVEAVAPLVDFKDESAWASFGEIDLAATSVLLGNSFGSAPQGGTWSGTITLTYDLVDPSGPGDSPYSAWAGGAAFGDDLSGDGVPNGLAFLLGAASATDAVLGLLPVAETTTEGLVIGFSMRNAAARGNASLAVQWSNDLGATDAWAGNTVAVPETSMAVDDVLFVIVPNGGSNDVTITIPSSKSLNGRLFARLSGSEE